MAYQLIPGMFQPVNPQSPGDTTFTKVFVGGLAWETRSDSLRRFFERFGVVLEADVITDKSTGRSKGYGFVSDSWFSVSGFFSFFCFWRFQLCWSSDLILLWHWRRWLLVMGSEFLICFSKRTSTLLVTCRSSWTFGFGTQEEVFII